MLFLESTNHMFSTETSTNVVYKERQPCAVVRRRQIRPTPAATYFASLEWTGNVGWKVFLGTFLLDTKARPRFLKQNRTVLPGFSTIFQILFQLHIQIQGIFKTPASTRSRRLHFESHGTSSVWVKTFWHEINWNPWHLVYLRQVWSVQVCTSRGQVKEWTAPFRFWFMFQFIHVCSASSRYT